MSVTIAEPIQDKEKPLSHNLASKTPLASELDEIKAAWLVSHACDQLKAAEESIGPWRVNQIRWESMSKEDYSSRVRAVNPERKSQKPDVLSCSNNTLGMSAGFWDYFTAQCRNDIFGTSPWLSATPEGRADAALAELISRHSQWKLNQSNIEKVCKDAIGVAGYSGTAFVKTRWRRDTESFKKTVVALFPKDGTEPIISPKTGDIIRNESEAEELGLDGDAVRWDKTWIKEQATVYDNVTSCLVGYRDIFFDANAPEFDLYETDVFVRFRMGILDVINTYGIDRDQWDHLRGALPECDEDSGLKRINSGELEDNQIVSLVEGFVRCDLFETGKPISVHVIFSPSLRILFSVDYLHNVTPGGMLPVFPVRIHKTAGKILGVGFFEKYENANDVVDRQYNVATQINEESSSVISAYQPEALADKSEAKNFVMNPKQPVKLGPGKTISDFIGFTSIPNTNSQSVELLNQMLQMNQMRSGITSAAQGELKGVPSNKTATGVRDLQSRGAILLKSQIDEVTDDIRRLVEFAVIHIYENQNANETFVWGEGEARELQTLQAEAVQGVKMNVTLTMAQSQNMYKLQNAQQAIATFMQWITVPEVEKASGRVAFVQAIASLGFRNADTIIREAAVTPEGVIGLLPEELKQQAQAAFAQAGLISAPEETQMTITNNPDPI